MQRVEGRFVYSATDLSHYLECKRLTELESFVLRGLLDPPQDDDPQRELIQRKGEAHEQRYLDALKKADPSVVSIPRPEATLEGYRNAEAQTLAAMRAGARIIYQAAFFDGVFLGFADFLRRVDGPSKLGEWRYEVVDTKLASSPKAYFLVQLCNYSEHLERLQGAMPERGYIVLGDGSEDAYRLNDYLAYYRHLKTTFTAYAADAQSEVRAQEYPYARSHCKICRWNDACTKQRAADDHLSLVAWMRRDQIAKLEETGVHTVDALANARDDARPDGMPPETFGKLRRQASLQVRGRIENRLLHEIIVPDVAVGFALLPAPADGDVFFDIEGDPLFEPGRGLEYLFGFWVAGEAPGYRAFWGKSREDEKRAFEEVVDFIIERRRRFPTMHVYHYATYEPAALKRLKQLHSTREEAVDELLRSDVFVDLYTILRQALVLSTDSYGLKKVEKFYSERLRRVTEVQKGDQSIVMFERWLDERDQAILDDIQAYNRDDCRSTWILRDWLLERRLEAIASHGDIPFRAVKAPGDLCHAEFQEACKRCRDRQKKQREEQRRTEVERELQGRDDPIAHLLAHLVAYHRREEQPEWWTYYHRMENLDELLEFDREAIAGLQLQTECEPEYEARSKIYTYSFPDQNHKIEPGKAVDPRSGKSLTVFAVDDDRNLLRMKTTMSIDEAASVHELIPCGPYATDAQQEMLGVIGEAYLGGKLEKDFPATYDLLSGRDPRPNGMLQPQRVTPESVSAAVGRLSRSYLFIQGPPGSGKTTTGSRVICDLLAAGKRVAVMSTGHKAIHNLLHKVEACMRERGASFRGLYKHSNGDSEYVSEASSRFITSISDNRAFDADDYQLAGGTAWLFSRVELQQRFDYLFIDEAGQVSLADALAVSMCARNVVLLGDPSQLSQVSQASHPDKKAAASVLAHLLGDAQTVPPHRGIFLDVSYRMHPDICDFVSKAMYGGRLQASQDTRLHRIVLDDSSRGGLRFIGLEHTGNSSSAPEEADLIVGEILRLLQRKVVDSRPADAAGLERAMCASDIIVVTPYNAQRRLIAQKLKAAGLSVKVGTVDKFQGQEAAVVFYSMATSSGEDVPRNMKFLFAANRFNVAVSRARALSVLVCSPQLLDTACNSPEEMALVNLLCAFAERAPAERFPEPVAAG